MHYKNGDLCPCNSAVRREEAVRAVCEKLCELIQQDAELIERTICRVPEIDTRGDDQLRGEISQLERKVAALSNKISDLYELAGQAGDDDRKEVMAKVRAAQTERSTARHELSRLQQALANTTATITPEIVRQTLAEFTTLLENAAAGKLGARTSGTGRSTKPSRCSGRWSAVASGFTSNVVPVASGPT